MGKQVAVASSVINLMGSEDHRPHYLKSLIVSAIREEDLSVADVIKEGYKNGPGVRLRSFYNWTKNDEEFQKHLGITSGELRVPVKIDLEILVAELPQVPGRTYQIESAYIGEAHILHWAEQWLAEHYPNLYHTDWECDHDSKTNMVTITFEDGTTEEFEAHSYHPNGRYLYVNYIPYQENEEGEVQKGNLEIFIYRRGSGNEVLDSFFLKAVSGGGFYPTIPFRYDNNPIAGRPYRWKIRMPFYFFPHWDNVPIGFATSKEAAQDEKNISWGEFVGYDGDEYTIIVQEIEGDSRRNGKLEDILNHSERPVIFIDQPDAFNDWRELPEKPIPIIPPTVDAYKLCKKAYRKAFNQDYDEVLEKINNHKNVKDIDYASVVFGVSLNTKDNSSKKYIYKFLQYLIMHQPDIEMVQDIERETGSKSANTELAVRSVHKDSETVNFRNYYQWKYITEELGTGILKEDKKRGDLWFEKVNDSASSNVVALCWQETSNRWRKIIARDFVHRNRIYGDNEVTTRAVDAINKEDPSGFIIILHEDIYRSLSLVDRTQVASACAYLVFNCYEVKKTNFWEDWGAIILTAIVIIIAVATVVATGGAGIGLLGSAEAVGGFLGFTGTTALIVGAAVNALAAILVSYIVIEGSALVFGEKWGRVIGAVITAIVTIGISAGVNSVNIIDAFTKADNLIKISQATTNAYSNYLKASAMEINEQTLRMADESSKDINRIIKMTEELYGFRKIDPTHVHEYISELTERMEDFLARTLITGSDIAEIQRQLITNFVENSITTKLP